METVNLTFRFTQKEFVKAERQYLFASKTITKPSVVILALYVPATFIYLFLTSFSAVSIIAAAIGIFTAIIGCALYFFIPAYKFKLTAKYHEEYNLLFSNSGIKFKTPSIDSKLKWSIYSEIWENDDFYFLIQAPRIYSLIPKRVFECSAAKHTFEEMALSNLKCTKRIL